MSTCPLSGFRWPTPDGGPTPCPWCGRSVLVDPDDTLQPHAEGTGWHDGHRAAIPPTQHPAAERGRPRWRHSR